MPHQRAPRSEPVACPICGRPLKWIPDRWLAAFECENCGEFSDFGGAAPAAQQQRHSQLSLPYESAREEPRAHEEDADDSGRGQRPTAGKLPTM